MWFERLRELDSFEWAESNVDQATFETLAEGHFTSQAHNLILVGGTGTGKTHLATALGIAVIHRGQRVRFFKGLGKNKLPQIRC